MKTLISSCLVLSLVTAVGAVDAFAAQGAKFSTLLQILRDNGTITPEQCRELKQTKETCVGNSDSNQDVKISTKGGLEVDSYDGNYSFKLGGRLMIDVANYDDDKNPLGSGTELRRARIDLEGSLFSDWGYEFGVDFGGGEVDVKDANISYNRLWPMSITVGQFKEPFSLEELTSSRYITFMERALPNEFPPGRNIGVAIRTHGEAWTTAAGIFGEAFDDDADDEGDEGWGITGRVTYAPLRSERRVLHLGLSASHREPNDEKTVKFNVRPESHITDVKFLDTGKIDNVDRLFKTNLEIAWVHGPLAVQGEYIQTDVNRDSGFDDVTFNGWYVFGSWFLTGESRRYKYKKGAFGRVKPRRKNGAWELAARYSMLNLNDGVITGGEEKNVTVGVNWYINPQVRLMLNYVYIDNDINADADGDVSGDDDPGVVQVRFQADF